MPFQENDGFTREMMVLPGNMMVLPREHDGFTKENDAFTRKNDDFHQAKCYFFTMGNGG